MVAGLFPQRRWVSSVSAPCIDGGANNLGIQEVVGEIHQDGNFGLVLLRILDGVLRQYHVLLIFKGQSSNWLKFFWCSVNYRLYASPGGLCENCGLVAIDLARVKKAHDSNNIPKTP